MTKEDEKKPISRGLRRGSAEESEAEGGDSREGTSRPPTTDGSNRVNNTTSDNPDMRRGLRRTQEELQAKAQKNGASSRPSTTSGSERVLATTGGAGIRRGLRRTQEEWDAKRKASRPLDTRQSNRLRGLQKNQPPVRTDQRPNMNTEPEIVVEAQDVPAEHEITIEALDGPPASSEDEGVYPVESDQVSEVAGDLELATSWNENVASEPTQVVDESDIPPSTSPIQYNLPEAQPVQHQLNLNLTQAQQIEEEELQQRQDRERQGKKCRRYGYAIIGISLLIIITSVVVFTRTKDASRYPTQAPSFSPTMGPTTTPSSTPTGALHTFVPSLPDYTQTSLEDPFSHQYQALEWLEGHPELPNMPQWRKEQLFALVTFYYAFDGDNWPQLIREDWRTYDAKGECNWFSNEFGIFNNDGKYSKEAAYNVTPCDNEEGIFQNLLLGQLNLSSSQPFVPPELHMLSNLTLLTLPQNNIKAKLHDFLPTNVFEMAQLKLVNLNTNSITGPLPSEFGLMTQLTHLGLDDNYFTGSLPSEFGLMASLSWLYLNYNPLTGTLPTELGSLTLMTNLQLVETGFTGSLPSELGLMMSMRWLVIRNNALTGTLPSQLGSLTNADDVQLLANALTGSLPSELGLMTSLTTLFLHVNAFTGTLPMELGFLTKMTALGLHYNALTGPLPSELGLMTSLKWLALYDNPLTGTLPSELGMMTSMLVLYVHGNALTGSLPSELGLMTSLGNLQLYYNALSGILPSELGLMTSLDLLRVPHNVLTGTLPSELGLMNSLSELYLHDNALSGTLPTELGSLTKMTDLTLLANMFTGSLPSELGLMTSLSRLYLHENALTGTLPSELGFLVSNGSLAVLNLESNSLFGSIPDQLCQLGSHNPQVDLGLSFDCVEGLLCGCCWCPCPGTKIEYNGTDCSPAGLDGWPGKFPTPTNSTSVVTLNIRTDEYPEEISWMWNQQATDDSTWETLDSGGLSMAITVFSRTFEVKSNTHYQLRIVDDYGDGFCCDSGVGWSSVTTAIPSSDHVDGSVIWNVYGDIGFHLDAYFWVDEAGIAHSV